MGKFIDLTGQRFSRLLVLSVATNQYPYRWHCRCDCGQLTTVASVNLKGQKPTMSCGCWRREVMRMKPRTQPFLSLYHCLVTRCRKKPRAVMHYKEFLTFTKTKVCHYCGCPIFWAEYNAAGRPCNLDRKDNTLGYPKANCLVCCGVCNSMKRTMTYKNFLRKISQIAKNRSQQ